MFYTLFFVIVLFGFTQEEVISRDFYIKSSPRTHKQQKSDKINVYWNIPTFQCDTHKLNFSFLADKYNFIQNVDNKFWGDEINILYDPGNFPAILKNSTHVTQRNGGVPQRGNLTNHLQAFNIFLNTLIPDNNFSGVAVIDFESWRPIFRQNFGTLSDYRTLSTTIEKQKHPTWSKTQLEQEATRQFEKYARKFMESTLIAAKKSKPNASWGYYAYPYCFNMSPNHMKTECPKEVILENDRLKWLFQLVDSYYPSLYFEKSRLNESQKIQMIEGRIDECFRIMKVMNVRKNIIPYFWYKYQNSNDFLTKQDLFNSFTVLASSNITGLIIWGSSNDVNTRKKCIDLYQYIDKVLGPLVVHIF